MISLSRIHAWDVSPSEARRLQGELAGRVLLTDVVAIGEIAVVAGVDNGYVKQMEGMIGYAAAVAFAYPSLEHVETAIGEHPLSFPYVPGLLSFREAPAIFAALKRLETVPDVILFDGQGYAHPRRFGLASHLGVVVDLPTVGCAKSRLVGEYEEPADECGAWSPLIDKGEVIGAAVRTRTGHAPLFVSPGHKLSVEAAVAIAVSSCRDGRFLPVPTEAAHNAVAHHTAPLRSRRRRT
ncbi:MAG: deoxyribonuclease V [Thermomicrobiales bacterium]